MKTATGYADNFRPLDARVVGGADELMALCLDFIGALLDIAWGLGRNIAREFLLFFSNICFESELGAPSWLKLIPPQTSRMPLYKCHM